MLIGQGLAQDAGDLVFQLPKYRLSGSSLIDIIPRNWRGTSVTALRCGCDTFRSCSSVVERAWFVVDESVKGSTEKR